jgi:hypothetical protein
MRLVSETAKVSSLSLQIPSFELDMETQYFREQAQRVRGIAEKADPLTKKRLLILVEHYDARALESSRPQRSIKHPTPVSRSDVRKRPTQIF